MNVIKNNNSNKTIFVDSNESNSNNNSLGGRSRVCLKTTHGFHYVNDPHVWGFCCACSKYFLEKGQRPFGKAYASNQPSFELDVKSYKNIDYLLGHYARLFGFNVTIVICLQSIHIGSISFFYRLLVWIVKNKKWC
jgi:hypothetical protein